MPQIISHRGYKGKFPENTLCAVEKAVEAGTHALELDLHLTRDGEVVLSHVSYTALRDESMLMRCRIPLCNDASASRRRSSTVTGTT